jgi:uncharacterized protein YdaU (DUF1376 family)
MPKDPAFLFYPGDWLGGTMGMSFEEKGAYLELLLFQFNNGKFTEAQAKQVLSICEASVLHKVLQKFDTDGTFFWKQRLSDEVEKRRKFSESRKNNAKGRKSQKAYAEHMENENRNENRNENKEGGTGEGADFADYEQWVADAKSGNDFVFADLIRNQGLHVNGHMAEYCDSYLALLAEYPRKRPPDQHRFRIGLSNHIREKLKTKQHDKHTNPPSAQTFEARRNYAGKL